MYFTWYWLADLCAREKIAFVLGHALYMKSIHGARPRMIESTPERLLAFFAAA
jgi:hypothetical protein